MALAERSIPTVFFSLLLLCAAVLAAVDDDENQIDAQNDAFDVDFIDPEYIPITDEECAVCTDDDHTIDGFNANADADLTPDICAVQYYPPNDVSNFTVCQLLRHNCEHPQNQYAQVLSAQCPPPYMPLPCNEDTGCTPSGSLDKTEPVCTETFVTKRKRNFANECEMQRASCLKPSDAYTITPCPDNNGTVVN